MTAVPGPQHHQNVLCFQEARVQVGLNECRKCHSRSSCSHVGLSPEEIREGRPVQQYVVHLIRYHITFDSYRGFSLFAVKIIIKGDRNVGKSCLLERLQGRSFVETYTPTEQIQAASIQWSFKATEDVVKVEVWDVVDRGKAKTPQTALKLNLSAAQQPPEIPALDAEFLDVYKGTHGVIMMMDVTKMWTYEYIQRELPKVPDETPVLILGNHCDMGHHRVVSEGQAQAFVEQAQETRRGRIMYGESSMRNGFGLRLLHKYLGLPFLRLQRETLLAQLERNQRDSDICVLEVNEFLKSEDADYNKFLDQLVNKRRELADSKSNTKVVQVHPQPATTVTMVGPQVTMPEWRPTKSIIVGGGQPIVIPGQVNITNDPKLRQATAAAAMAGKPTTKVAAIQSKIASVEDFCPDGGLGGFLEDLDGPQSQPGHSSKAAANSDSEDEADRGNPLVAQFQDDHGDDDEPAVVVVSAAAAPEVKVNPLAKPSKSSSSRVFERPEFTDLGTKSESSTDLDVGVEAESEGDKETDFDSWINDTTRRRSPEGGEDPTVNQISIAQEPFASKVAAGIGMSPVAEEPDAGGGRVEEEGDDDVIIKKHKKKKSKDGKKDREDKVHRDKEKKKKKKKSKHESSGEDDRLEENSSRSVNVSHGDYECI